MASPAFTAYSNRIIINRRPKNPQDRCTVVSVFPLDVIDFKPTAFPQTHRIEAAPAGDFSCVIVEGAAWYKEDMNDSWLEIPIPSMEVAEAFVLDYVSSLPEFIPGVAHPGLFYVLGAHTKASILKHVTAEGVPFSALLDDAKSKQREWFLRIVKQADTDWARTSGNPTSVGNTARIAAEFLGMKDKPWLADFRTMEKSNCKACGFMINPAFPICPNCKSILDEEKAKSLGIKFAS